LPFVSQPRRPRRTGEWTSDKAVTFIVTLAATGSVTLAALRAGMSRKSAYALKGRDPAFTAAWIAAVRAHEGDKVDEVHEPPVSTGQGDALPSRLERERSFVGLMTALCESPAASHFARHPIGPRR
jgi:hypothetical protein